MIWWSNMDTKVILSNSCPLPLIWNDMLRLTRQWLNWSLQYVNASEKMMSTVGIMLLRYFRLLNTQHFYILLGLQTGRFPHIGHRLLFNAYLQNLLKPYVYICIKCGLSVTASDWYNCLQLPLLTIFGRKCNFLIQFSLVKRNEAHYNERTNEKKHLCTWTWIFVFGRMGSHSSDELYFTLIA